MLLRRSIRCLPSHRKFMIYADYNGSAPLLPAVREYLKKRIDSNLFANPNAIHSMGQKVAQGIERCREIIAHTMGCYPDQIFFNSGASEGISNIIHSVLEYAPQEKKVVITGPIEHVVVHKALQFYADRRGFLIESARVSTSGEVDLKHVEELLKKHQGKVALVTIMAANNETGVIQPYEKIAALCQKSGVDYFSDTTQLIGKGEFHFINSGMDFAVCGGHKVGALTGVGFIMVKEPPKIKPFVFGSYQERGVRGGTQHYIGIETLAIALQDFYDHRQNLITLKSARIDFEKELKTNFPQIIIIGEGSERLAGTSLIGFPGIHGQAVQIELESHDIFVTTSAACADNQPETSATLKAIGVSDSVGRSVIRISLSYSHGKHDYAVLVSALKASYNKLSKIQSY